MEVKRGEIYFANLGDSTQNVNSEQEGYRPVLIIQNNIGNKFSPTIIAVCLTSKTFKAKLPTHVLLNGQEYGLSTDSLILCEQIKTLDKTRLHHKLAALKPFDQSRVDKALKLSIGLEN